ncbi:hypothetical protein MNBD_DELTA03-188 [hydrothermal vent metagenome]|uniref:Uncharacterized protein n=1 Tax=hydrothermal vent metagenome TaxID=652676 RepID=A0A3B0UZU8_9ZZZZ
MSLHSFSPLLERKSMFFESLKSLLPPSVPRHGKEEKRMLRRKAASMTSRGNVSIQLGKFLTKDDLRARKKVIFATEK